MLSATSDIGIWQDLRLVVSSALRDSPGLSEAQFFSWMIARAFWGHGLQKPMTPSARTRGSEPSVAMT
jgi:hypothetical protein